MQRRNVHRKWLNEVTHYYLTKEKNNVESVFAVNGFGFAGRGQNTGIAFVSLKDWADRPGEENKVEAITMRANTRFLANQRCDGFRL
ncbi:acriflavin resistance protein B [Escherichia coli]|uniref:Acriflavin resistance protein B n=1 Tax=Escherichia coli TaxID=562 RepID=A0A377DWZ1_ECOLX|nr:acriflavin resistance protein B [Escherichia coli]